MRVSNQDDQTVGIQIVYGDVAEEVKKAEASNRPLLIYSWLPRPEIMTPNRFVRITLESFYHCGKGDPERDASFLAEPSLLAEPLLRGVAACDFPVEQVEKAAVWRLLQPSATNAKLFVGKFSLSSTQLEELLELGKGLNLLQSSDSSPVSPDEIACRWLNDNTEAWEAWLPSSHLYDTTLFQWADWVCLFVLGCAAIWKEMNKESQTAKQAAQKDPETDQGKYWQLRNNSNRCTQCCWWCVRSLVSTLFCWKCSRNGPLKEYLSDAASCLVDFGLSHREEGGWLLLCAFGKIFVAASSGLFKIILYETWLGDGLSKLSIEVSISCAVLMLTLELIEWFIDNATDYGEQILQDVLTSKLTQSEDSMSQRQPEDKAEKLGKRQPMGKDRAETLAKKLANDCYVSAAKAFYKLLGVVFAIGFLFYYTFKEGVPRDLSPLTIAAFFLGPIWLMFGLGSLLYRTSNDEDEGKVPISSSSSPPPPLSERFTTFTKRLSSWSHKSGQSTEEKVAAAEPDVEAEAKREDADAGAKSAKAKVDQTETVKVKSYEFAFSGVMWISRYLLWALAPIFMTPLISDFGPGTNSALQSDVLTVSTHVTQHRVSMWGRLHAHSTISATHDLSIICHTFITNNPCL